MKTGLFVLLAIASFIFSCKKNDSSPHNRDEDDLLIPLPSQKCHLSSVKNSNGTTIRHILLNKDKQYAIETDRYFSAAGKEQEYYRYYNKEESGNKYIFQEYHIWDGNNDYINGYYKYHINQSNNLFLDSVEIFICTNGQCRADNNFAPSDFTKLASEIYLYNTSYKLKKKQYYNIQHQPDGYFIYSYNSTGLLIKEETFKEDNTLSSSVEYTYSTSGNDFAFKGEPSQVEKLLFGYARSVQEYKLSTFNTATGNAGASWIIKRFDDNSDMKGYLQSIAPERYPDLLTTYEYTCE
ncbi:MAG: hypothetical protein IT249_13415 [Chitinophagaceae bacterium]|nr:hypothetical protein [Chitinophagaceae bacterium]